MRIIASIFFFLQFFAFAIWYRCTNVGNIVQRTPKVFLVRNLVSLVLYGVMIYTIYLEYFFAENNCKPASEESDGRVVIRVMAKSSSAHENRCNYQDYFLAGSLVNTQDVMEYHKTHIILLCALLFKEIIIYLTCVRRAYKKLEKEEAATVSK